MIEGQIDELGSRLTPALPQVGMPCLSFIWEIIMPPGWEPVDWGEGSPRHRSARPVQLAFCRARALEALEPVALAPQIGSRIWVVPGPRRSAHEFGGGYHQRRRVVHSLGLGDATGRRRPSFARSGRVGAEIAGVLNRVVNNDRTDISATTLRRNGLALVPALTQW